MDYAAAADGGGSRRPASVGLVQQQHGTSPPRGRQQQQALASPPVWPRGSSTTAFSSSPAHAPRQATSPHTFVSATPSSSSWSSSSSAQQQQQRCSRGESSLPMSPQHHQHHQTSEPPSSPLSALCVAGEAPTTPVSSPSSSLIAIGRGRIRGAFVGSSSDHQQQHRSATFTGPPSSSLSPSPSSSPGVRHPFIGRKSATMSSLLRTPASTWSPSPSQRLLGRSLARDGLSGGAPATMRTVSLPHNTNTGVADAAAVLQENGEADDLAIQRQLDEKQEIYCTCN